MHTHHCKHEGFSSVVCFDGVRFDVIYLNCVEYDNVFVASVRGNWETSHLVCEQWALDVNHGHEHHVCFVI